MKRVSHVSQIDHQLTSLLPCSPHTAPHCRRLHPFTHTLSLTHAPTPTHIHTLKHTHTHAHTYTQRLGLCCPGNDQTSSANPMHTWSGNFMGLRGCLIRQTIPWTHTITHALSHTLSYTRIITHTQLHTCTHTLELLCVRVRVV